MRHLYHREPVGKRLRAPEGLTYFTHEVDGRLYGGWYRRAAGAGAAVELYARGQVRRAKLGRLSAEEKARTLMEEIVRSVVGTPQPLD